MVDYNINHWLAVSSFFQKRTYRALSSVGGTAESQRTVASLVNMVAGPLFVNSLFLTPNWHAHRKAIKAPLMKAGTRQGVSFPGLIFLLIRIGDLQTHTWWFHIVEKLAGKLLDANYSIDMYIHSIFPTDSKVLAIESQWWYARLHRWSNQKSTGLLVRTEFSEPKNTFLTRNAPGTVPPHTQCSTR